VIDAHQHFWSVARDDYGWLTPDDAVLYRDFSPEDLEPLLRDAGVDHTVLVQAAPTVAETRYLLDIAERTDWVAGVVGWVALDAPDVDGVLDELCARAAFRGVRPMIQDMPDDDWMLADALTPALRSIASRGLCFDALVHPRHLPRLLALLERHPELRVVVDHGAKPEIRAGRFDAWAADMTRIGRETRACCKLSGLVTEAADSWQVDDIRPYVDHLLESFGPDRLMWGSDWPVVELAGGYTRWREATFSLLAELSDVERAAILGGTAARVYHLESRVTS
jgi:L-fuconolactonase